MAEPKLKIKIAFIYSYSSIHSDNTTYFIVDDKSNLVNDQDKETLVLKHFPSVEDAEQHWKKSPITHHRMFLNRYETGSHAIKKIKEVEASA